LESQVKGLQKEPPNSSFSLIVSKSENDLKRSATPLSKLKAVNDFRQDTTDFNQWRILNNVWSPPKNQCKEKLYSNNTKLTLRQGISEISRRIESPMERALTASSVIRKKTLWKETKHLPSV